MDEICQSGTEYLQSQALTTDAFLERKRHSLVFRFNAFIFFPPTAPPPPDGRRERSLASSGPSSVEFDLLVVIFSDFIQISNHFLDYFASFLTAN